MPEKEGFGSRLKHAWNAFLNRDPPGIGSYVDVGPSYSFRPDKPTLRMSSERTIIAAIINRISIDVSRTTIQHVRLDENHRFDSVIESGLNNCLTLEANIDQTAQQFKHDITFSMLDEGYVAIVPIDTKEDPRKSEAIDIKTMRVCKIVEWHPQYVRVEAYNDRSGQKDYLMMPKSKVAIVENPFYTVMNEPNSTLKRLVRKMALLDSVDEQSSSGKLDLLVQLPYAVKGDLRIQQAELRRKAIEDQLVGSRYGIAYIDSTEHVTQLNRPVENTLQQQIEYLQGLLYNQLGLTKSIIEGNATDAEMTNYYNQTIEPIVAAIVGEMNRKFLTKTARSQGQTIYYFKDPFKFIPVTSLANIADVMTRNAIMSSNEFRQILGMKAAESPDADALRNKNMPVNMEPGMEEPSMTEMPEGVPSEEMVDTRLTADTPIIELQSYVQQSAVNEDEDILIHADRLVKSRKAIPKNRGGPDKPAFKIKRIQNAHGTGG